MWETYNNWKSQPEFSEINLKWQRLTRERSHVRQDNRIDDRNSIWIKGKSCWWKNWNLAELLRERHELNTIVRVYDVNSNNMRDSAIKIGRLYRYRPKVLMSTLYIRIKLTIQISACFLFCFMFPLETFMIFWWDLRIRKTPIFLKETYTYLARPTWDKVPWPVHLGSRHSCWKKLLSLWGQLSHVCFRRNAVRPPTVSAKKSAYATSAACRELIKTLTKLIPETSSFNQRQLYPIFALVGIDSAVRSLFALRTRKIHQNHGTYYEKHSQPRGVSVRKN